MAALAAVFPLAAGAQSRSAPAPAAVPVPASSWRVFGSGSTAPSNKPNDRGGIDQQIRQDSQRAIYQWQSFDIGQNSSVTFEMSLKGGSALNRVVGNAAPSQIFGRLTATNGGEIYLVNRNGILFGRGAQVDTGSLVASALNISDGEYLSGLTNNLLYSKATPAFAYDGEAADFVDSKNFVRVDEGAQLVTGNGGRVFLFAKRVENAGTIQTPGGQTILAAGGSVYVQQPSEQLALYASESNPSVPTLRGLLVEVGAGPARAPEGGHGSVVNETGGVISTPRGNATLVGLAVNQLGRVSATTSVTENGSIILRAQGAAAADGNQGIRATQAGALVLGPGSQTLIAPDDGASLNQGKPLTSDGNATFVNPRIDLAGNSVLLDRGAKVVAPGATVDVRAETTPNYEAYGKRIFTANNERIDDSRIVLGDGAVIDVSGTTDAQESVARYFVTTELLGSNDLKDAPLQKDGLLYRSRATLDVRDDSPILGPLDGYRNALQQGISERLSSGGQVRLTAGSAVLTHANSRVDVSGGQVTYAAAEVRETQLVADNGQVYDLNNAPADLVYAQALNLQRAAAAGYDRWGVKVNFGSLTPTHHENGYVEGRSAGQVKIVAPHVLLDGQLDANVVTGERQRQALDGAAGLGQLHIGAVTQLGNDFASSSYDAYGPLLKNFFVSTLGPRETGDVWLDPQQANLPDTSGMRRELLSESGFGEISIAAIGTVAVSPVSADPALSLTDGGVLRLLSQEGNVTLGGATRIAGGTVEVRSKAGSVTLIDGASVDLSGRWTNVAQDGPSSTTSSAGGNFSARGFDGLTLGQASLVDVSGGGSVDLTGKVTAGNAGAINLVQDALPAEGDSGSVTGFTLGGRLAGQSLGVGGSLALKAPGPVQLGTAASAASQDHALNLDPTWFNVGGFSTYSVEGRGALDVSSDFKLNLQRNEWHVDPRMALLAPSGTAIFPSILGNPGLALAGPAPGVAPAPVNLTLSAVADASTNQVAPGTLTVNAGAVLNSQARSSISLKASDRLLMDGTIATAGGSVSMTISPSVAPAVGETTSSVLWLGQHSRVDVAGQAVLNPTTNGLRQGSVIAGGSISLTAARASSDSAALPALVVQQGAQLDASGATAILDRAVLTTAGPGIDRTRVDSAGGRVNLAAGNVLVVEGQVDLHAGGGSASGGTLSVSVSATPSVGATDTANDLHELRIGAGTTTKTAGVALGDTAAVADLAHTSSVSASLIASSGAANVALSGRDSIRFLAGADVDVDGTLTLSSRSLTLQPDQSIHLAAGQVQLRETPISFAGLPVAVPTASAGTSRLDVQSAGAIVVSGDWVTRGIDQLTLSARGDLILQGEPSTDRFKGSLISAGDLNLSARQVYPSTQTDFTISAAGREVVLARPADANAAPEVPLSAGGHLTVNAATITQSATVRAPMGQVVLRADESVTLSADSETSVSSAGLLIPYGSFSGSTWTAPDTTRVTASPLKRIELAAPGVDVQQGAKVNLNGGGDLAAYEFVPGRGGSTDVFAGGNGAYALIPGVKTAADYDASLPGHAPWGQQIVIGEGAPVPAGTYTLLPARYALQQGAFLIEPAATSTAYGLGVAVAQPDGSTLVGARLGVEGSAVASPATSTWRISSSEVASRRSEVRTTSANVLFASQADKAGIAIPELPRDAGTLSMATVNAQLAGDIRLQGAAATPTLAAGRGGRAEFAASRIVVGAAAPEASDDDTLHLSVGTLNNLGAKTVLLGASSGSVNADASTNLSVRADSVTVAPEAGLALSVQDVVLAAKERVSIESGASMRATASGSAPEAFVIQGDGASVRLSGAPGANLVRTAAAGQAGMLEISAGSSLQASTGSLLLEASLDTKIGGTVRLDARDITLGAAAMTVGATQPGGPGVLALTPALLAQVGDAEQLTLRAYDQMNFKDGAALGLASDGSVTLNRLVLDAPVLNVTAATAQGARVTAGDITLVNTSANQPRAAIAGEGKLALVASSAAGGSGELHLADGSLVVNGVRTLGLSADEGIQFSGVDSRLATGGEVTLLSRGLVAERAGASATLVAGGTLDVAALPDTVAPASMPGGNLNFFADNIHLAGRVVLPGGAVTMNAVHDLRIDPGSRIDVSGRQTLVGTTAVDMAGGVVTLTATEGNLDLLGGVVNVSGGGEAAGGRLSLNAPMGGVTTSTLLRGTSAGSTGAQLTVDALDTVDVAALARQTDEVNPNSFAGAIRIRQRQGDLTLGPAVTLSASEIALAADGGALTVQGTLDASGADAGTISLSAHDAVTLSAGASLQATAKVDDGRGGRVSLSTTDGRLQLQAGSRVDVSAGTRGEGGRLTMRAPRTGIDANNPGGTGVAIVPLQGDIAGAGRIDVEAVKVYDGIAEVAAFNPFNRADVLTPAQLARDGIDLVGVYGLQATAVAERLGNGIPAVEDVLRVHPSAEVRGAGGISVSLGESSLGFEATPWVLPTESVQVGRTRGGDTSHVGDTALTIRAAGDLNISSGIESGFGFSASQNSHAAGTIQLVAGADMTAADATQVSTASTGSLFLQSYPETALRVRSTTGNIVLAASGDVDLRQGEIRAYTTGVLVTGTDLVAARRASSFDAFATGAGDVTVRAGGSILSQSLSSEPPASGLPVTAGHPSQWFWTGRVGDASQPVWYVNHQGGSQELGGFENGIGSFGGGRLTASAGRDIVELVAASPSEGFVDGAGVVHKFGGGSVQYQAGRDVVGGIVQAGGRRISVVAGRDVAYRASALIGNDAAGLLLSNENTEMEVTARRDATMGAIQSSYAVNGRWLSGLDVAASASVTAAGGNLIYRGDVEPSSDYSAFAEPNAGGSVNPVLPTRVRLAAPSGDMTVAGSLTQQTQSAATRMDLLAGGGIQLLGSVQVNASWTQGMAYHSAEGQDIESKNASGLPGSSWLALATDDLSRGDGSGLDQTDRNPVHITAANGDVTLVGSLRSARPLDIRASRDVLITGTNVNSGLEVQHQAKRLVGDAMLDAAPELSVIQAGRDIGLGTGTVRVAGPGELLMLAGRDIDLGRGAGVQSVGNIDNATRLAEQGTNLTLVAGLRGDGLDYQQASLRGFAAVGAAALEGRAADLYALLSSAVSVTPALGSAVALEFAGLPVAEQMERIRALIGDGAYRDALADYVRSLPGRANLTPAQAVAAFSTLSDVKQAAAPGVMLAGELVKQPQSRRHAFIAEVAAADARTTAAGLQAYMARQTGSTPSLTEALAAFEALPMERQIVWMNQVLVDEVRAEGRAAVSATGSADKEAAYGHGYAAINAIFPIDRTAGNISLPSSQLRTVQPASITMMLPGGSLNAGETGSSFKSASELGIVTVGGGAISALARDDILVNQSRIFTLARGDILLWSSLGDVDAGRGGKTVVGAPAPVYRLNDQGRIVVDTSGSFSGSGIAALSADSALDLYAPSGAIDAGEAGIRAVGTVVLGAEVVRGADDIKGGSVQGAPPAAPTVGVTSNLASAAASTTSEGQRGDDDEDQRKKRRARRNLLLEFLGFGRG